MTLIDRITGRESRASLAFPTRWMLDAFGVQQTSSGENVNEKSSLQQTAVWSAVNLIAGSIGSLPLFTYERLERGKRAAYEHHLFDLLHDQPNPDTNSQTFFELATAHVLLYGNHYSEIERDRAGRVIGLWQLDPAGMRVFRRNQMKLYGYVDPEHPGGSEVILPADKIFHVRGLGTHSLVGISVIHNFIETLGVNVAAEKFGGSFYRNGARPSALIEWDGEFKSQEDRDRWLREWAQQNTGVDNTGKTVLLKKGMKYVPSQIAPDEAQFLESRNFGVKEIARIFNIPSALLNDTDGSVAFASAEQKTSDFLTFTLRSWLTRWQAAMYSQLVPPSERKRTTGGVYVEFKPEDLLRADPVAESSALAAGRNAGWLSVNDIRTIKNMNPIGEEGDIYLVPLNMVPASQLLEEDPPSTDTPPAPEPADDDEPDDDRQAPDTRALAQARAMRTRRRIERSHQTLIAAATERALRREITALLKAIRRASGESTGTSFARDLIRDWIDEFYPGQQDYLAKQLRPVFRTLGESIYGEAAAEIGGEEDFTDEARELVDSMAGSTASRVVTSNRGQLRQILRDADDETVEGKLEARSSEWEEKTPAKIAQRESVQIGQAVAKVAWAAAGATALRWVAVGENCPLCDELDGRVVGMKRFFVSNGETVKGEGVAPLTVDSNKGHPPLHEGCDCMIVPD